MNIKSQEILMLNRGMKNINNIAFSQQPETGVENPIAENPTTEPMSILNAMHMQSKNNITFQSSRVMTNLGKNAKPFLFAGLMSLFAASCQKKPPIIVNTTVNVTNTHNIDLGELATLFETFIEKYGLTQEAVEQMLAYLESIMNNTDESNQNEEQMISQQEQMISQLAAMLLAGGLSGEEFKDALKQILEMLGIINGNIENLASLSKAILLTMRMQHTQNQANHDELMDKIDAAIAQDQINGSTLQEILAGQQAFFGDVSDFIANSQLFYEYIQNPENWQAFAEYCHSLGEEDREKLYEMLSQMGIDINMNHEEAMDAYENWIEIYQQTEAQHQAEILEAILGIAEGLPGIEALVLELNNIIANGGAEILELLKDFGDKLNTIIDKLNNLVNIGYTLVTNSEQAIAQRDSLIVLANNNSSILQNIEANQNVTNEELQQIEQNTADMKQNMNIQIQNSQQQLENIEVLIQVVTDIQETQGNNGNGAMTKQDFLDAVNEFAPEHIELFMNYLDNAGFADNQLKMIDILNDLKAQHDEELNFNEKFKQYLERSIAIQEAILEFLQNADFSDPNVLIIINKMDEVLQALADMEGCLCNENEGVIDSLLQDLEGLLPDGKRLGKAETAPRLTNDNIIQDYNTLANTERPVKVIGFSPRHKAVGVDAFNYKVKVDASNYKA